MEEKGGRKIKTLFSYIERGVEIEISLCHESGISFFGYYLECLSSLSSLNKSALDSSM